MRRWRSETSTMTCRWPPRARWTSTSSARTSRAVRQRPSVTIRRRACLGVNRAANVIWVHTVQASREVVHDWLMG